jgi:hypothetical protein
LGAYENSTPVTVHVAIGTDARTRRPTRRLSAPPVPRLPPVFGTRGRPRQGGVSHIGSAVLLPRSFSAISAVRNLGHPLAASPPRISISCSTTARASAWWSAACRQR